MSLGQIAVRASGKLLTAGALEKVIGGALGYSTIALAPWVPERVVYVGFDGAPPEVPRDTRSRGVTRITWDNRPVAAPIHDPTLDTDADVVEGLAATSRMLLENAHLVEELRASRSRIVETAERERRRLERDLRDGAQQRLMAIQLRVGIARELADSPELATELGRIQNDAEAAVDELRALARGIYPAVLGELGPAAALRSLTSSSAVAFEVIDKSSGRSSEEVEATIYFCAREAIQNTAKHAGPGAKATVTLARHEDTIQFIVRDDGAGMQPNKQTHGTGLTGMRDQVQAVGGQLEIVSAPGHGTSIRRTIPDGQR